MDILIYENESFILTFFCIIFDFNIIFIYKNMIKEVIEEGIFVWFCFKQVVLFLFNGFVIEFVWERVRQFCVVVYIVFI